MNKFLTLAASAALISGQLLITGCSSSDDSSGGGVAAVPANATAIDASNAESLIASISTSLSTFDQAFSVGATPLIGLEAAVDIIKPMINNRSKNSGIDLATGVAYSDSGNCDVAGTFSVTGDETDDGVNFSDTFSASFTSCDDGVGFIIDGSATGTETENYSTGEYTDSFTGSISITFTSNTDTVKVSFTGLDFSETGNNFNYTYTTSKATFALVVTVNGANQYGFLAQLGAPIVESTGDFCPESGHILVTGANGTTAEGIYNGDGTMTIKANGTVVRTDAPCY